MTFLFSIISLFSFFFGQRTRPSTTHEMLHAMFYFFYPCLLILGFSQISPTGLDQALQASAYLFPTALLSMSLIFFILFIMLKDRHAAANRAIELATSDSCFIIGPLLLVVWGPQSLLVIFVATFTQTLWVGLMFLFSKSEYINKYWLSLKGMTFVFLAGLIIALLLNNYKISGVLLHWRNQLYEIMHIGFALMSLFVVSLRASQIKSDGMSPFLFYAFRVAVSFVSIYSISILFKLSYLTTSIVFLFLAGPGTQPLCVSARTLSKRANSTLLSVLYFFLILLFITLIDIFSTIKH